MKYKKISQIVEAEQFYPTLDPNDWPDGVYVITDENGDQWYYEATKIFPGDWLVFNRSEYNIYSSHEFGIAFEPMK